jgi:hypothetical protein
VINVGAANNQTFGFTRSGNTNYTHSFIYLLTCSKAALANGTTLLGCSVYLSSYGLNVERGLPFKAFGLYC